MSKILRIEGEVNKVYFSSAIVSIEHVNNDAHGNVYTEITFSDGSSLKVSNDLQSLLYEIDNSTKDVVLEKYDYKIKGFVV